MVSGPSRGRTSNDFLFLKTSLIPHSSFIPFCILWKSPDSAGFISYLPSFSISLQSLPSCRVLLRVSFAVSTD